MLYADWAAEVRDIKDFKSRNAILAEDYKIVEEKMRKHLEDIAHRLGASRGKCASIGVVDAVGKAVNLMREACNYIELAWRQEESSKSIEIEEGLGEAQSAINHLTQYLKRQVDSESDF